MYSVMDYWYITTRLLCPIFWEMPTTNIFDKMNWFFVLTEAGADPYKTSAVNDGHVVSDAPAFSSTTEALWLSEYDWGFSINKRPFTNREHTDKTGLHPMVYYCQINNGISTIMDITINDATLYENALEKSFNRCMYVTVIFYRNKEIGLSSRHYKLTGILSEGQFIPIRIRNQWLL